MTTSTMLSGLAVLVAYLVGSIPFAYVLVRAIRGIDIRTVGSGNVGATNAGRVLGFKFFLLVFGLDVLKGMLPTLLLPRAVGSIAGASPQSLPVWVGLATILGHNFPIYLGFKGGKGVATSLGAMIGLDPIASSASVAAFLIFLAQTRYVSMSSILGAMAFAMVHFTRTESPWSAGELPMSVVTLLVVVLLVVRHRGNLVRIAKGTEPKVPLGRLRRARASKQARTATAEGGNRDGAGA